MCLLQNKCPRYSNSDDLEISELLRSGVLFATADMSWKTDLKRRLNTIPTLIPSFETFFDDLKLMEAFVPCIYHIVDKTPRWTANEALRAAYTGDPLGYNTAGQCIWLFVMQNFLEMPAVPQRDRSRLLAKPRPGPPDEEVLYSFAVYAGRLGFTSSKISSLKEILPETLIARRALLKARKIQKYEVGEQQLNYVQSAMVQACLEATALPTPNLRKEWTGDRSNKPRYMAGFPDALSFDQDKELLDGWDTLTTQSEQGEVITSFFRLRSLCCALFQSAHEAVSHESIVDFYEDEQFHRSSQHTEDVPIYDYLDNNSVFFKTLENNTWIILRQVQATQQTVEKVARELCDSNWCLLAIDKEVRIGTITPSDCFDFAKASGISTILAFPADYNSFTIISHAKYLYEGTL